MDVPRKSKWIPDINPEFKDEYVSLPPKLPPKPITHSLDFDVEPRSSRLSETSSALRNDDKPSVPGRHPVIIKPASAYRSRPEESRRAEYRRSDERDQASWGQDSFDDPARPSVRRGIYDSEQTRERRYIVYDDAGAEHRPYSSRNVRPENVYKRDEQWGRSGAPMYLEDRERAAMEKRQQEEQYLERLRVERKRMEEEEYLKRLRVGNKRMEEEERVLRLQMERESSAIEQSQRRDDASQRYVEEREEQVEVARLQALQLESDLLGYREARSSQGRRSERDRMGRERQDVVVIHDNRRSSLDSDPPYQWWNDYRSSAVRGGGLHEGVSAYPILRSPEPLRRTRRVEEDQARLPAAPSLALDRTSEVRTVSRPKDYDHSPNSIFYDLRSKVRKILRLEMPRSDRVPGDISASIVVNWDFHRFLRLQFKEQRPKVDTVLTLTGTARHAQATTCGAYAEATWPASGPLLSALLQNILESGDELISQLRHPKKQSAQTSFDWLSHGLSLQITLRKDRKLKLRANETLHIRATGAIDTVEELILQLAWAGAVFNSAPVTEDVAYTRPIVTADAEGGELCLDFETERILPDDTSCWLPLFSGACIAYGFPVPQRQDEVGLEIPLHILAALVGAGHAVEYDGGVVIKGFSNMIIPMKKTSDTIQWHLITAATEAQRLSYREGLGRCGQRAMLNQVDLDSLRNTRAILGWCTAAESALGSQEAQYAITDYSRAIRAETALSFTGGTLGMQQFAVGQLDFSLGAKDGKCHFQRTGPYSRIIRAAEKTPVVLYDTSPSDRRGWLVTAAEVILHMLHHRNQREPFEVDGRLVNLPGVEPDRTSATDVLLRNAHLDLYDPVDGKHTLKDMVLNCWSLLEFLIDQNVRKDQAPGTTLRANLVETVQGYEYMAIVDERSPFQRKQTTIAKSNGGWLDLVHDIDALVLFASGFGEVMRPMRDVDFERMCLKWRLMPKEKDYLAASVKILKDLYDVAGSRLDRKYLTSTHLQWHRGNSVLFESCATPQSYRCHCDRLQQVLPGSTIGAIIGPGPLVDAYHDGAVIFGQAESRLRPRRHAGEEPRVNGIYGQRNATFVISDVGSQRGVLSGGPSTIPTADIDRSTRASIAFDESPTGVEASMRDLSIDDPSRRMYSQRPYNLLTAPSRSPLNDLQRRETWSLEPQQARAPSRVIDVGRSADRDRPLLIGGPKHHDELEHPYPPFAPPRGNELFYELDARRPGRRPQYREDSHERPASSERDERHHTHRTPQRIAQRSPTRQYAPLLLHSGRPSDDVRRVLGVAPTELEEDVKSESSRRYR